MLKFIFKNFMAAIYVALIFAILLQSWHLAVGAIAVYILAYIAEGLGYLPIVEWTDLSKVNGRNYTFYVEMDTDVIHPLAVLAQEVWEDRYKSLIFKHFLSRFHRGTKQYLEIMGHEVEVQAAVDYYDQNEARYRKKEAQVLTNYPQFRAKMSETEIYNKMLARKKLAKEWYHENKEYLLSKM